MKLDLDIRTMSIGQLRQALQKVRQALRVHRDKKDNARCWHNDLTLYGQVLPEAVLPGKMNLPEEVLLKNCRKYIRRQQCNQTIVRISKK